MSLEDYIPKKLDDYYLYKNKTKIFLKLRDIYIKDHIFFNIIINGIANIGKKTLVYNFIDELFVKSETSLKQIEHEIKVNNNTVTTYFKKSLVHYIIDPSVYINYDKIFISTFIDKYVNTINIFNNKKNIVIIENSDKLTISAQEYLKKKIESVNKVTNFILISNSLNRLDKALISRFVIFNIPCPKKHELKGMVNMYMKKLNFKIPNKNIDEFLNIKPFSLYNFILNIHTYRMYGKLTRNKCEIIDYYQIISLEIFNGKYANIGKIRNVLFNIMISNIDNRYIFRNILNELLIHVSDNNVIRKLCSSASKCEEDCNKGNKPLLFLELFCIESICIIKNIDYLE